MGIKVVERKPKSKSKIVKKKFGRLVSKGLKVLGKRKPIKKLSKKEMVKRPVHDENLAILSDRIDAMADRLGLTPDGFPKPKGKTKTTPKVKAPKAIGASKKARKATGKEATDLQTPASVATPGSGQALKSGGPEANVGGVRKTAQIKKEMDSKGKTLTRKQNQVKEYKKKADSLTGVAKIKYIAENRDRIKLLKASIQDMKRRDITPKRGGGKVSYRAKGGKSMPISTTGKHGGKKQMAAMPGWMKGLSDKEIKQILGAPTTDSSGVTRHSKKATKKGKTVKAKGGGKVVYRKISGKVLDGNELVAMIYKND